MKVALDAMGGDLGPQAVIEGAIRAYAEDVRSRAFPTPEHTYPMQDEGKTQPVRARERVGAHETRATKKPKNPASK